MKIPILLLACFAIVCIYAHAQSVIPLPVEEQTGEVIPKIDELEAESKVIALGVAPIINGDEKRARKVALQDAYRQAISQGVGCEIGELFEMRNFEKVVDVVIKRSIGIVKNYRVMQEGRKEKEDLYEILIEAEVGEGTKGDLMALALFLEVIDSPTVLILLREYEPQHGMGVESRGPEIKVGKQRYEFETTRRWEKKGPDNVEELPIETAEIALAKCFHDAGYTVLTSDDILTGNQEEDREVQLAKKGYTKTARNVGRKHGADVVLCGTVRISGTPAEIYGMPVKIVHISSTVKAVVTGSGQTLAIEDAAYRCSSEVYEGAKYKSMEGIVKELGERLVWKIPEVLANNYKILSVTLSNCEIDEMKRLTKTISEVKGVDRVRTGGWARKGNDRGEAKLSVYTGFLGATTDEIYGALASIEGIELRVEALSKYALEVTVKGS